MTIYDELVEKVIQGWNFYINFRTQDIKVGHEYLVKNGQWDKSQELIKPVTEDILQQIEELYIMYKYSRPTEKSETSRRKYFKALPMTELADEYLIYADDRSVRQAILEGFILCHVLNGTFTWKESYGKWFWQSERDKDLVILKEWITVKNKYTQ